MTFSETTISKALVIIHFNSIFNSHIHMGKILGIKKLYALVIRYALPARILDGDDDSCTYRVLLCLSSRGISVKSL